MKRRKRRRSIRSKVVGVGVAVVLATVGFAFIPYWQEKFTGGEVQGIQAGVPQIEKTQEEGYEYEYEAATFDVLMGKKQEKPIFKVRQGLRELDISVNMDYVPSSLDVPAEEESELGEPSSSPSPGVPTGPEEEPETDDVPELLPSPELSPSPVPSPSPSPSLSPSPLPSPSPSLLPSLLPSPTAQSRLQQFLGVVTVQAQEVSPSPSPEFVVSAGPDIQVVTLEAEPAVEYKDKKFKLTPNLDKVTLDFEVASAEAWPVLSIKSKNLTARNSEDGVVFQTRTNRKAFELTNANVVDGAGFTGRATLDVEMNEGGNRYEVSVTPEDSWFSEDRVYPVALEIELVSLFHDRMLPAWPVRKDFRATEDAVFDIDVESVEDEVMKAALADDALPEIRFGLIDPAGDTEQLSATVLERQADGHLKVALSASGLVAASGLFDLLIQHGEDEAYISQEDFSWGVLAINPDMAVYPEGSEAKIDMAVLDPVGRMVCDADLTLDIKDPTGVVTTLTRADDSIKMTEGCFNLVTNLADYTTTYQTGPAGTYDMTLTAVTKHGSFTVQDSFAVDPDSPFYIKRLGPTRIFPLHVYNMTLEVTRSIGIGQAADLRVEELVSDDFEVTMLDGGYIEESSGVYGAQRMVWEQSLQAGETATVRYTFDAPDISPALFLLGPASIDNYVEPRRWQIASDLIGQEASTSNTWDSTTNPTLSLTVTSGSLVIVQVMTSDGTTTTISDDDLDTYTSEQAAGDGADPPRVEQFSNNTPTTGTKTITINGTFSGSAGAVSLTGTDTTTPVDASSKVGSTGNLGAAGDISHEIITDQNNSWMMSVAGADTNVTFTKDATQTEIFSYANGGADKHAAAGSSELQTPAGADTQLFSVSKAANWALSSIEVNVAPSSGPVTADLMRHGNYFSSSAEQSFYWAQ